MDNSFVKLSRKILKWEWYTVPNMVHLFTHLILKANFKDGKFRGIKVKRGQLITGRLKLAMDTGLSEMQVRTCLKRLKLTKEITINVTNKYTVVTLCNYEDYQDKSENDNQQNNQQSDQQITNNQPNRNQQVTIIEEELRKKEREVLEGENIFVFKLQKIYDTNWQEYSSIMNGQAKALDENKFLQWKSFVDFVRDNKFEDLFNAKFVSPIEFEKLVSNGFTSEKWEGVLKSILATGIKPEHNLFFRIPQFIEYVNADKKNDSNLSEYEKKLKSDREKYKNKKYTE